MTAIAAGEGLAHAELAFAIVVVPAVVEEVDAAIDGLVDELNGVGLRDLCAADVVAAEADGGDALAGAAELAIDHAVVFGGIGAEIGGEDLLRGDGRSGGFDEGAAVEVGGGLAVHGIHCRSGRRDNGFDAGGAEVVRL